MTSAGHSVSGFMRYFTALPVAAALACGGVCSYFFVDSGTPTISHSSSHTSSQESDPPLLTAVHIPSFTAETAEPESSPFVEPQLRPSEQVVATPKAPEFPSNLASEEAHNFKQPAENTPTRVISTTPPIAFQRTTGSLRNTVIPNSQIGMIQSRNQFASPTSEPATKEKLPNSSADKRTAKTGLAAEQASGPRTVSGSESSALQTSQKPLPPAVAVVAEAELTGAVPGPQTRRPRRVLFTPEEELYRAQYGWQAHADLMRDLALRPAAK